MKKQAAFTPPPQAITDPTKPALSLLVKLGSIAVHVSELHGPDGRHIDRMLVDQFLNDIEIKIWIKQMGVMLPLKRTKD